MAEIMERQAQITPVMVRLDATGGILGGCLSVQIPGDDAVVNGSNLQGDESQTVVTARTLPLMRYRKSRICSLCYLAQDYGNTNTFDG
ncbi:hypothetical protein CEXT_268211 [Caerostris extrusa]|uniref:Uncharacterized protein n=1 Tax=Caerostris extrusa TaxID=172846 RepID=A0AAV4W7E9_CAEEX|nr:hypothetical protein CEXT_268211 [Caerostris extrusa]